MDFTKRHLFSLSVLAVAVCTTAHANVRGMNSQQLAQYANAQTQQPTYNTSNQSGARTIHDLSVGEKAYILSQLAMLQHNQVEEPENTGFTTVRLKPKGSRISQPEKVEETIESTSKKQEAPVKEEKAETATQQTENDHGHLGWMAKVWVPSKQEPTITTAQQLQEQKRKIAVGHFGSAQVQQASYQMPNNQVYTGQNVVRRSSSSAPTIGTGQFYARGPATIQCVIEAANKHNVPAHVLLGIASKEYGRNGQTVRNTNNSYDMGHFQLNTIHFRPGEAFGHIKMEDARWRGCYNAELAAWHLNRQLTKKGKEGVDFWTRAGGYHSWTPGPNRIYVHGTAKNKGLKHYAQEWLVWLNKNPQYQSLARNY
ncbi:MULTISPECIES: transglycosylase SLT domain-containing protein [Acinetobacter]|uniref:Transglycosylase SLT domain-containing protein n=1 Tax=Acinetobacter indicus TaxID=756892 RepID=A0A6C0Y6E3_9GAMM|nr:MULTISPECIES: transglycosylase SLT domain-containing protein [Acinetobacter]QIC71794.1 transglycosylase SLT domain-containing protein [Acinetobacter indicus]QKQ71702.1 hypothetical protein E5Y90_15850 [Acinetobacter sp. 10FS3-1]